MEEEEAEEEKEEEEEERTGLPEFGVTNTETLVINICIYRATCM